MAFWIVSFSAAGATEHAAVKEAKAASLAQEHFQQVEFYRSQVDGLTVATHATRRRIKFNLADAHNVRRGRARFVTTGPPQNGSNARHQLPRVERFRQIIVGADLQTNDAVNILAARSEQKHGQPRGRADSAQHLKAIDPGQHYIQDHEQVAATGGALQAVLAIMHRLHLEPRDWLQQNQPGL